MMRGGGGGFRGSKFSLGFIFIFAASVLPARALAKSWPSGASGFARRYDRGSPPTGPSVPIEDPDPVRVAVARTPVQTGPALQK